MSSDAILREREKNMTVRQGFQLLHQVAKRQTAMVDLWAACVIWLLMKQTSAVKDRESHTAYWWVEVSFTVRDETFSNSGRKHRLLSHTFSFVLIVVKQMLGFALNHSRQFPSWSLLAQWLSYLDRAAYGLAVGTELLNNERYTMISVPAASEPDTVTQHKPFSIFIREQRFAKTRTYVELE